MELGHESRAILSITCMQENGYGAWSMKVRGMGHMECEMAGYGVYKMELWKMELPCVFPYRKNWAIGCYHALRVPQRFHSPMSI